MELRNENKSSIESIDLSDFEIVSGNIPEPISPNSSYKRFKTEDKKLSYIAERSSILHNNKYTVLKAEKRTVTFICPVHREVTQSIESHFNSVTGCKKCELTAVKYKLFLKFQDRVYKHFGDKYKLFFNSKYPKVIPTLVKGSEEKVILSYDTLQGRIYRKLNPVESEELKIESKRESIETKLKEKFPDTFHNFDPKTLKFVCSGESSLIYDCPVHGRRIKTVRNYLQERAKFPCSKCGYSKNGIHLNKAK
jgi:hypothetical protein